MTEQLPDDVRDFLRKPNPSVMATLGKDGRPVAVATWYLLEDDGRILLNLDAGRVRLGHIRRDPRVALDVLDFPAWGTHVALELVISEIVEDPDLSNVDRIARHYTGEGYANRERPRVSVYGDIQKWMGWGVFKSTRA
jgi:PPOX class probable F420-dependent enzyme